MSRRDDPFITTQEEASQWLFEFRHTITDGAALKVIEQMEIVVAEYVERESAELAEAEDEIASLESDLELSRTEISHLVRQVASLENQIERAGQDQQSEEHF